MQESEQNNSYLPLFRKYRPQSFEDVIGQEFTVKALENAIKLNKIANAYLFCGPRGTGKTSSARIFAKSLNCKEGPTVTPCQKCQSCLDVTNASGLDVIEIDAATNRGIDDAKELISKVQYPPMNGKFKIFIIDEVHMLSKEAFNALLKTFEEPPKNVIFILATTEPHKVIETIVSRCQRFDFRRITIDDIVKRLKEISEKENINITEDALFTIAKNVSGGMRDSLALLDQASVLGIEKQITAETIEMLIGKLTFDVLYNLTEKILNEDIEESVKCVENIFEKGSEPRNFVENYIEFLRNIILLLSSKNEEEVLKLTLLSKENASKTKSDSNFEQKKLISILDKAIEFYKEIKNSTNPYLWAELMVIHMTSSNLKPAETAIKSTPKETNPLVQIKKETANKAQDEPKVFFQTAIEDSPKNEPVHYDTNHEEPKIQEEIKKEDVQPNDNDNTKQTEPIQSLNNPVEIWSNILNKIESIPAKFFYSGVGKLVSITENQIVLGFVNQNVVTQAKSDSKFKHLKKAMTQVLGDNAGIEFITITENTKILEAKVDLKISAEASPAPLRQTLQNRPVESPITSNERIETANETDKKQVNLDNYTRATREMLEAYNGRIIE